MCLRGKILMSVLENLRLKLSSKGEIKATVSYFVANICTKAIGFVTIPIYTNILTTSEYGYLNSYNAWVSMLSVILGLSLSSTVYGQAYKSKKERNEFQSYVLTLSLVAAVIISGMIILGYVLICKKVDIILLLAIVQGYATFILNFIMQEWILDNCYLKYSFISVITAILPIVFTLAIIRWVSSDANYYCVIFPRAAVLVLFMLPIIVLVSFRGKKYYSRDIWAWSLKYSTPIVFHTLSLTIMLQADRVMISYLYGYDESGIYSFIYNVTLVVGVLIAALENTWKTWFFKKYEQTDHGYIRKKAGFFISIAVLGIGVYLMVSPELVSLLADESYLSKMYLVGPIAFAYIISFLYDFLVYVEYKKNQTKNIAMASIVAAITNMGLNVIIIPILGGVGAAITTIIAYIIQFFLHLRVVSQIDHGLYPLSFFIKPIIYGIVVVTLFLIFLNIASIRIGCALVMTGYLLYLVYKNKNILS